jgi:hypothetical protein
MFGSTGTVIDASVLAATDPGGDALTFLGGSVNLTVTGSTLTSAGGRGAALEAGNGGVLSLSSDTFQGGVQCLSIAAQQAGTTVWISSNLVLPILEANPLPLTYGIYLNGLTTGATIYDNEVYYRTAASNLNNTANPLYATGSTGLLIERNRFNSAGAISNGSLSVVTLSASQNVGISFNDFNFSVGGLNNVYGLQIIGSTATVTNNVFNFSGSASSRFDLWVNAPSGIKTDYNDWYAGGAGLSMTWGSAYTSLSGWQATGQDAHSLSADPLWPNLTAGSEDFHPRSVRGRCSTPNSYTPTSPFSCTGYSTDTVHSPTIDAGDPAQPFDLEPVPHGRRVNIGSYGNTPEASESRRKLQVILIQ